MIKTFKILLFILLLSLPFNIANSEILKFKSGIYEGGVKKNKAHGLGKLTFKDGGVYEGKFKKNKAHGLGKLTFKDGAVYEGKFKNYKAHGLGKLTFKDGGVYEGKFKNNKIHGKGKYTSKSGEVFEGKWKRNHFYQKVNKKTRKVIALTVEKGMYDFYQLRGKGQVYSEWFNAEKIGSEILLTKKGKRDQKKAIEAIKAAQEGGAAGTSGGGGGGGGGGC
jgi:hypothetical protein